MKKALALLLALAMVFALAACGSRPAATGETPAGSGTSEGQTNEGGETQTGTGTETTVGQLDLIVFAAASLTESLTAIKANYESTHPGVNIIYAFGSSGDLSKQIKAGAECDLFISAGQKQMNQIDKNASAEVNTDGSDFVVDGSRVDLLENKVVLVVPDSNPKNIRSFDQLAEMLKSGEVLMGMGGAGVPVGDYTKKILTFYGLNEEELANAGHIAYGSDVKEVTTYVKSGNVDCGVIYASDAFSGQLTVIEAATKEMCGQIIYPAALIKSGHQSEAAADFLAYLQTEEAMREFEAVLFSPAP
ncbi:MAG: molybdate ABC transporter substrate-binding protein [Oscillospiraceae bacterium]|nr:molybdate ABC transporter substrate-binding protein [Oscillospiraceae bacterium]